jgi:hypothetical protein
MNKRLMALLAAIVLVGNACTSAATQAPATTAAASQPAATTAATAAAPVTSFRSFSLFPLVFF